MIKNLLTTLLGLLFGLFLFAVGLLTVAILITYPKLPSLDEVKKYEPKEPPTTSSSALMATNGGNSHPSTNFPMC